MITIKSLDDIFASFPFVKQISNEFHTACPFCHDHGRTSAAHEYVKNGITFIGDDRFFWHQHRRGFYCRHCQRSYSIEQVCERLFTEYSLDEGFVEEVRTFVPHKKPIFLHTKEYVNELHRNVRRSYWYRFGWSDEIIDRFKLGYGKLYEFSRKNDRHIIPFIPSTVNHDEDGWALEGRLEFDVAGESRNVKTQGLTSEYFWKYTEGESDTAIVTEGIKDGISAFAIGYRHIFSFFGGASNLAELAPMLRGLGYKNVILCAHNDDAGSRYVGNFARHYAGNFLVLKWPKDARTGYDLTNLLEQYGIDGSKDYIDNALKEPTITFERGFVSDIRAIQPDYEPPDPAKAVNKNTVRQELPFVLDEFIDNYQERRRNAKRGIVKVLASDPGSGKSFAMVRLAEKLAKEGVLEYQRRLKELTKALEELEKHRPFLHDVEELQELDHRIELLRNRMENLSCATVLYAGPFISGWDDIIAQGADQSLWFNYEARNKLNCENLVNVSQLAAKGYSAMAFCQAACPLKARCEEMGYLAQEKARRSKPITYVRHQQLTVTSMVAEYKYILIDENCFSVFDDPVTVSPDQLIPVYNFWDTYVDDQEQIKLVIELVEALRVVIRSNRQKNISGYEIMEQLNVQLLGKLEGILLAIDQRTLNEFHPKVVMGELNIAALPIRSLPMIVQVLAEELPLFKEKKLYNSSVHIVDGNLEIYPLHPVHIASNHPIIVSDGTPMAELYGLLFDREVEIYGSNVYDSTAKVHVWYGSDFTRTSISRQLGPGLKDFNKWMNENPKTVNDIFGEELNLDDLPVDENLYDSSMLKRALSLLKMVAEKHSSVLFVTYKNIRLLIEKRMEELYPELDNRIYYGHYGSLRGTNRYKDVEAVLLVGCPRVPYDSLHRRIQAWAKLAELDYIPFELTIRISPYHGVFRYEGNSYISFPSDFADSFVNMVEVGEIQQSLQRIRPFTSEIPKHVYLALSRPAAKWVTALDRVGGSANRYESQKYKDVINFMMNSYGSTGKFPTFDLIKSQFNISYSTIAKLKKEISDAKISNGN